MGPYDKLMDVLGNFPPNMPKTDTLRDLLEVIFNEEEASLASHMSLQPSREPLTKICEKSGLDLDKARALLEGMADKGVVFVRSKGGESLYSLMPIAPGIIEFQFMKGEFDPKSKKIAELFNKYYFEGFGKATALPGQPIMRSVAVQQEIPVSQHINTYEKVRDMLMNTEKKALTNCFCRHEYELLGKGCGKPKEVCMVLGPFSDFAVERGFARRASDEEILIALDRAEEAGLVNMTDNLIEKTNFMCHCCGCCCGVLGAMTKLNIPGVVAHTNYIISRDEDACTDCGDCVERCQIRALSMGSDEKLAIDLQRCIGCGLCVRACEQKALSMIRRKDDDILEPYNNMMELGMAVIQSMNKNKQA